MKKTIAVAVFLLFVGSVYAAQRAESIIKTFHLNPTDLAISCKNGANPTILPNTGNLLLIVSCGK